MVYSKMGSIMNIVKWNKDIEKTFPILPAGMHYHLTVIITITLLQSLLYKITPRRLR